MKRWSWVGCVFAATALLSPACDQVPPGHPGSSPYPITRPSFRAISGTPNCRLPLANEIKGSGGFLDLGSGSFKSDANSLGSWDAPMSTWVPVPQQAISPEGDQYADVRYIGGAAEVILHTLKPLGEKSILTRPGGTLVVIGYTHDGVYVEHISSKGTAIWLLDPQHSTSSIVQTQSTNSVYWLAVSGGYAWGDSHTIGSGSPHSLLRLNLRDGASSAWLPPQAPSFTLLGFTIDGAPVIALFSLTGVGIGIATSQFTIQEISQFPANPGFPSAHSDRFGIWFSNGQSVWLYSGKELKKVAVSEGGSAADQGSGGSTPARGPLDVAGPCIPA